MTIQCCDPTSSDRDAQESLGDQHGDRGDRTGGRDHEPVQRAESTGTSTSRVGAVAALRRMCRCQTHTPSQTLPSTVRPGRHSPSMPAAAAADQRRGGHDERVSDIASRTAPTPATPARRGLRSSAALPPPQHGRPAEPPMSAKASDRASPASSEAITLPAPITRSIRPLRPVAGDDDESEQDDEEDDAAHDRLRTAARGGRRRTARRRRHPIVVADGQPPGRAPRPASPRRP